MRRFVLTIVAAVLPALTGCDGFFVPVNGGTGTTGNYAYVANSATNTVSGLAIGTGTLTNATGSPNAVGYPPAALVLTPNNGFLYVAGPGAIYVYTVGANGSLTGASGGAAVAIANVSSLDVSPDGNWLFGLDTTSSVLDQYKINQSTGALSVVAATPYTVMNAVVVPKMVRVAPNGALIFIALGTGGDIVFTFNTSTGAVVSSQQLSLGSTTSDNGFAINSTTTYLYIARSGANGGLAVYSIGTAGALNAVAGSPFVAGTQPTSVVLDSTGTFVYVANRADGTISGYTIGTGSVLTPLAGSPYASGSLVTSLGRDNSGKYILAAAFGGAPDVSMYSFDSTIQGKLNLATSTPSGTDPASSVAIALTH